MKMERDTSQREALRRKAEEARAATAAAMKSNFEDDDTVLVTGRPKFAPPVKSLKQDSIGEKLKSSLGAFEEVAPLLQMKNRPIYGVSTCPQTPVATSVNKPAFPLDANDPQPSTSAGTGGESESKRNGGFLPPSSSRREKISQNGSLNNNARVRSPSSSNDNGERNRKRPNGEWDHSHRSIDRNGRNGKNDRHELDHASSHSRRLIDDSQQPDSRTTSSTRKDQRDIGHSGSGQNRRGDHQSSSYRGGDNDGAGDRRRVTESRDDPDNSSKRVTPSSSFSHPAAATTNDSSGRRDERHRVNSEKTPSSKASLSIRNGGDGSGKEKEKIINRHDRDRSGSERYDKKSNQPPAVPKSTIDEPNRKRSRSPAEERHRSDAAVPVHKKTGDTTAFGGDKSLVHKREHTVSEGSTKKHGQTSLRLETLSTLRLGSKDGTTGEESVPSTPSIEKMIKKVTDIVDAPPLSGIPAATPFSYPIKTVESDKAVTKATTNDRSAIDIDGLKRPAETNERRTDVSETSGAALENGEKSSTLADDLSMSDSDNDVDSDSDSDSAINKSTIDTNGNDLRKTNQSRLDHVTKTDGHSTMNSTKERAYSESPKKDESKSMPQRPVMETVRSTQQTESKPVVSRLVDRSIDDREFWGLSQILNSMTPMATKTTPSQADSVPSTSIDAPADTGRSSKNLKKEKASSSRSATAARNSNWEKQRQLKEEAIGSDSDGESTTSVATGVSASSYGKATSVSASTSGAKSSSKHEKDDSRQPPKISLKLKNGKVHVVDSEKSSNAGGGSKNKRSSSKRSLSPVPTSTRVDEKSKKPKDYPTTSGDLERGSGDEGANNTGKENLKWSASANESTSKATKLNLPTLNGKLYETDAEAILQESRLSPLLSPIHEFPPFQFVNGKPSLLCQIPLNMLERVPKPRENGRLKTTREMNGDENFTRKSLSPKPKPVSGDTKLVAASVTTNAHDLDEVSLLDRMEPKKRRSVAGPSTSSLPQRDEQQRDEKPSTKPPAASATSSGTSDKTKFRGTKNPAGNHPLPSAPSKVQPGGRNKTNAKRKTIDDSPPADPPPSKVPRLDMASNAMQADAPLKRVELELDCAKEQQYQTKAKEVKHDADSQVDKTLRIMLYMESVVYFIMTGLCMEKMLSKRKKESSTPHTMIKTTVDLLKNVAQKYTGQMSAASNPSVATYVSKVEILSMRIQSLCCFKMFEMRQQLAISNYRQLNDFHKTTDRASSSAPSSVTHPSSNSGQTSIVAGQQNGISHPDHGNDSGCGVTPSPTPSPASSTGSSHSLPPGLVAIPQQIEILYKQQLSHLHSLMWAHYHWQEAERKLQTADDKSFFEYLDGICGRLALTSDLHDLCSYVLTAVTWLRQSYVKRQR